MKEGGEGGRSFKTKAGEEERKGGRGENVRSGIGWEETKKLGGGGEQG